MSRTEGPGGHPTESATVGPEVSVGRPTESVAFANLVASQQEDVQRVCVSRPPSPGNVCVHRYMSSDAVWWASRMKNPNV